jgi:intracellular septation protein A
MAEPAAAEPSPPQKSRLASVVRWVLESFGPLIAFVVLEHTVSLLAAIISSIVTGVVLVALQIARERKVSPFTAFIAASVALFGVLDLKYRTGFFVKLEPALGNALTGLFFLGTVAVGRPIILELAEKQLGRKIERAHGYLRKLTIAWGLFFFARAAIYVWMAYRVPLDRALAIRGIGSPVSFAVMVVGEMGLRYLRYGKRAFGKNAGGEPQATPPNEP